MALRRQPLRRQHRIDLCHRARLPCRGAVRGVAAAPRSAVLFQHWHPADMAQPIVQLRSELGRCLCGRYECSLRSLKKNVIWRPERQAWAVRSKVHAHPAAQWHISHTEARSGNKQVDGWTRAEVSGGVGVRSQSRKFDSGVTAKPVPAVAKCGNATEKAGAARPQCTVRTPRMSSRRTG